MEQNSQLAWPTYKNFRNAQKQHVHGYEYVEIEPYNKTDTLYEFDIGGNEPLAFGVSTGFRVEGKFQVKKGADDWIAFTAADAKTVSLQPNWFEHYLKNIHVFYVNQQITADDMPPNIDPYVNTFLYAHMDKNIKKLLCTEACHPGNAVSVDRNDFKATGLASTISNTWTKYAEHIAKDKIAFMYTPLQFPFFQDVNYVYGPDGGYNPLPIQALGRMQIRVYFKESSSVLFNGAVATNEYRFLLTKFTLLLKELRMSPTAGRQLSAYKGTHYYRGLTKIGTCYNFGEGQFSQRCTISNLDFPEGVFIFCVDKKVLSGTAMFKELSADGPFLDGNISSVDVHFNGQHFFVKNPTFGSLENYQLRREKFAKMVDRGMFGMRMDPNKLKFERQGTNTDWAFTSVWIDFTESGPHTRLQPVTSDQTYITNKPGELVLIINFNAPGGAKDVTYVVMAYHTDFNMQLDMRTKKFSPVYNRNKNIN